MRWIRSARGRAFSLAAAFATVLAGMVAVAPAASASTFSYVNMGDSLSSGEGTYGTYLGNTNTPGSNICHRSPNSYSAQYAGTAINSYSLVNVACSGAGINDILYGNSGTNTGGNPDVGDTAPQVNALSASTRLVTLSVGINDVGLIEDAQNCYSTLNVLGGEEDQCFLNIPNLVNFSSLETDLKGLYGVIRNKAPNATIAVVNYPQIYPTTYSPTGLCEGFPVPIGPGGIGGGPQWLVTSQAMLDTAHNLLNTLNQKIASAVAASPGVILVDVSNALAGHDVCSGDPGGSGDPWVNQINGHLDLKNVFVADDESLHPTVTGYQHIADRVKWRLDAGHFSGGTVETHIASAYQAYGGLGGFGYPADNGGGPYVHYWGGPGQNVEDFTGGAFGPTIIVDGPSGAFFINYGFRDAYIGGGYNSTCRAPTDNAYASGGGTRQDFVNCYMTWTSSTGVVVHGPNPATCTNYGGSTMTGPNACVGFYTGSVWFSGHGVGLFGQEIWTYSNGNVVDSTAHYSLSGLDTTHVSQLQAYIPNNYSDAPNAHYHYCSPGGGCGDGYLNQNNYTNQWATFGSVCTTDGTATIVLADDGGNPSGSIIGADAIRAVRIGIIC